MVLEKNRRELFQSSLVSNRILQQFGKADPYVFLLSKAGTEKMAIFE